MTAEGARGETALQMGTVLRFPEKARRSDDKVVPWDTASIHMEMATIKRLLLDEDPAYEINIANALWLEQTYPFRPQFLAILNETYGAAARQVDFIFNPDPTRIQINNWVEEQTIKRYCARCDQRRHSVRTRQRNLLQRQLGRWV